MTFYATRSQAARYARREGITCFQSILVTGRGWKFAPINGDVSEALAYAKGKDFISHVEAQHIDGGRQPGFQQVLVVTCFKDELPEGIPPHFVIAPITPSLWAANAPDNFEHRARSSSPTAQREKSAVESPTKLVWAIADEMVGADRAAVIAACVEKGVNKSTAQTQYYRWAKDKK